MTWHPAKSKHRVVIIGGGASGLAAACVLSRAGLPFLLLEKESRPGKKLLATGNGRCNLMNMGPPVYFGQAEFAHQVLATCGIQEVQAFFEGLGLPVIEEEAGRAYPRTRQAASVLDCLLSGVQKNPQAQLQTGVAVQGIKKVNQGFLILSDQGNLETEQLILAVGGPAAPRLGGTDSLLPALADLGLHSQPFFPALCPLETETRPLRGLSGQRLPAWLSLMVDGQVVDAAAGELLMTDYGVSGLCAMQLARAAQQGLEAKSDVRLRVDLSPLLGLTPFLMRRLNPAELPNARQRLAKAVQLLKERLASLGPEGMLTGLLPRPLANKLQGQSPELAASFLTGLQLQVQGTRGFDQAQVAAGGLDCSQFSPKTLEAAALPGFYACGEALNVDGDTGGFNLLFAWASGILAAQAILNKPKD